MKKEFVIRFDLLVCKNPLYYGYRSDLGPFLTPIIGEAYKFYNLDLVKKDASNLMKFFFAYSVEYTILSRSIGLDE